MGIQKTEFKVLPHRKSGTPIPSARRQLEGGGGVAGGGGDSE